MMSRAISGVVFLTLFACGTQEGDVDGAESSAQQGPDSFDAGAGGADQDASDSEAYADGDVPYVEVLDEDGFAVDAIDVSISDEDFKAIATEFGLWDVPLDENGDPMDLPDDIAAPPLSSSCSIASSVTTSSADQTSSASKSASCYNYATFSGDSESDCYIKYSSYAKKSKYYYDDTNTCARTADLYYGHTLAAYYDSSSNVYLRLDSKWCKYSNCEDGFKIKY